MKKMMLSLAVLTSLPCMAKVLSFVQSDFDLFVTQSVPQADQERFRGYYAKLQTQMQSGERPETTRKYIYTRGFEALERDHAGWSEALTNFMSKNYVDESYDGERTEARSFVYWHGAYEEFKQATNSKTRQPDQLALKQEQDKATSLTQAKSYVAKATQKVSNWFKGFYRS